MGYRNWSRLELLTEMDKLNDRIVALDNVLKFLDNPQARNPILDQRAQYISDIEFLKKEFSSRLPPKP